MPPWSSTTMRSALCTVASRCAMTSVVRSGHRRLERGLHHALAFGVERAGRFVEQQQRRVLQHRPRDRDALALAARQAHAALAEEGLVALGQGGDEVVREGRAWPRRCTSSSLASGPAVADVLHRVGREDHAVLRHDADARAQVVRATARRRRAVERTRARLDVVEAQDQLQHRALAGAARADQRDRLARRDAQAEVAQRRVQRAATDSGR